LKQILIFACVLVTSSSCSHHEATEMLQRVFADTPVSVPIKSGIIDEASGIADSRANPGFLWVEQDSGNSPELALLAYNGTVAKKIYIKGVENRDWEDLALAKGPDASAYYIYLGDIGDNFQQYSNYFIYRFKEPASFADTISIYDKITFKYPDGANNAEAILVNSDTKDIYVIRKALRL
jgi:hypothetical protein